MSAGLDQTPLASPEQFEAGFAAGLARLLAENPGPGAFILVLANALTDPRLQHALEVPLAQAFARIAAAAEKGALQAPPDDQAVMARLLEMGLAALAPAERAARGPFEVRFNPVRALRPARMTGARVTALAAPFNPEGFNFNRPFLLPERLWGGELLGREADLFYNKFPFVEDHLLLTPDRSACRPQLLDAGVHDFAWELAAQAGGRLPGTVIAYNALGAFASVNHLHLHLCRPALPLPIFDARWEHNGGELPYPARCLSFTDPEAAWSAIARLHADNCTYHLLYLPGRMLLVPRKFQGDYALPPWAAGTTWYEIAGGAVAFERAVFEALGAEEIGEALSSVEARGHRTPKR